MQEEITLSSKDIKEYFWNQDGVHFSHPLAPLFASYMIPAMTEGTRRAMASLKAPVRQFICKIHEGYFYQTVIPAPGDPDEVAREHDHMIRQLMGRQGANLSRWVDDVLLPLHREIDQMTSEVESPADALSAMARLHEIYLVFWDTHFQIVLPRMAAGFRFEEAFKKAFPSAESTDAYALLLGVMNKSLETDREIWLLSQRVKQEPAVLNAFQQEDVYEALLADPATGPFRDALASFLATYGWRTMHAHEFMYETWVERPDYCLSIIKGYLQQDFDFDSHWDQVVKTREERMAGLLSQIADADMRREFLAAHQDALDAWPIDEDHHFYIDAMLPARARQLCRKVGQIVVAEGLLPSPDDIFYLYDDEVVACLAASPPSDLLHLVAARRAAYQEQLTTTPPSAFGTPPADAPDLLSVRVFGGGTPGLEGATNQVRGFAASPGRYVGPVRLVRGPEEFFKVRPGDVLVCRSTAPSWTALFATVGAVITDTGGILSHAATVAREYGIPCVVGTREGSRVFQEGDIVLVDGSQGMAVADG